MSVPVYMVVGMRNLRLGISLITVSVFALLVLRYVPGTWLIDVKYANPTVGYVVLGLIFYVAIYFLGSQSLEYFRFPRFHFKTGVAFLLASVFVIREISYSDNFRLDPWVVVRGLVYLLAIGFGEEMMSRAFVFGVLHKFGIMRAIFGSSALFGLMHVNIYVGSDWDAWSAYWHVMGAFGFGVFACALMIVTRSIWMAVIFHALNNWGIIFDKALPILNEEENWIPSFWQGLVLPLPDTVLMVGCAMLLLWIDRGEVPHWLHLLAHKWKLIEEAHNTASYGWKASRNHVRGALVCAKDQKQVEPVSLGPPQALASNGFPS